MNGPRNDDAAGWRLSFQSRGDVDAVAVEIVSLHDQVAKVQAHAEHEPGFCGLVLARFGEGLLKFDGRTQGVDGAGELDQGTVPGELDRSPAIPRQDRIEALGTVLPQTRDGAALIPPDEAGVADNVGGKDRRQFSLLTGHGTFPLPFCDGC